MAYAALLSFTRTLENILLSCDESLLVLDEELQIKSLQEKLGLFISFLEETSQKNSKPIEDLEEKIRDVVYEAEDIIESHMSKQIHPGGSRNLSSTGWYIQNIKSIKVLYNFFKFFYTRFPDFFWPPFLSRSEASTKDGTSIADSKESDGDATYETKNTGSSKEINNEEDLDKKNNEIGLKNVRGKLDSLWEEVEKMKNENKIEALQIQNHLRGPVTPGKVESTSEIRVDEIEVEMMQSRNLSSSKYASQNKSVPMVGLADDMLRIKELLIGSSTQLETISIVGMGGIGKTTLARSIYNDPFVTRRFDVRAWTTVSQKYNVESLLIDLLKSMGNPTSGVDMEELKLKMYQNLKEVRYLIIMDDVWDINFLKEFKKIFPDDDNGSRIIMTTRSSQVANFERYPSHIHRMNFLSPEQSLNLLLHKALGEGLCPLGLKDIGWKIAEKCKGLPLALIVTGGLLYKAEKRREHWKYVEENMKSAEAGNYNDLMEILSLSYNNLPYHLRTCFLYMAIYPEDYIIHVSHLIRLWLAEGFIKPIPTKTLEQVAKEYIEDLTARNLVIVRDRSYYGEIKTYTIHDLMRDLCMRKARETMSLQIVDNKDQEARKNQRFFSFQQSWVSYSRQPYDSNVRSLLYFGNVGRYIENTTTLLRVLDLSNKNLFEFPTEVVRLANLRYLALSCNHVSEIPASVSKLYNLQTLTVIRHGWRSRHAILILYLPAEMFKMPWLRHLLVDGSGFQSYPSGAPNWNLQVLAGMIDFRFTEEAIEKILDLKTLEVVYRYPGVTEWSFYCVENLVHLHQLENLKFHFIDYGCHQFLPNFCFPQKLNKLTLSCCMISSEHTSTIGSLPNLQVLKFKDVYFKNNVWETNEGEFSELKFLLIDSRSLKYWVAEGTHFPSLECLSLRNCHGLNRIPREIGEIPTLQHIVLYRCNRGVVDSANEILKEQHDFGNENFQLHMPHDYRSSKFRF